MYPSIYAIEMEGHNEGTALSGVFLVQMAY